MASWRPAKSLITLRDQVDVIYPNRDKSSDGLIGDSAHAATHSEHNPDINGVVRALDITNDPAHGLSSEALAQALVASRDPRILYVISNRKIANSTVNNWAWRPYNGSNPHDHHVHISVVADPKLYDDTRPWAIKAGVAPVNPVKPTSTSNFNKVLPLLLEHEGGNDDDPRDPGGRTSRGILQREWNEWRLTHPGLPSDVWQAPQSQVEAIYKQKYWDALDADNLPSGVDYALFDYGVNSGVGRARQVQKQFSGVKDPVKLINLICDQRLNYLEGLPTWPTFGKGWARRVKDVRAASLAMVNQPKAASSKPTQSPTIAVGVGAVLLAVWAGIDQHPVLVALAVVAVVTAAIIGYNYYKRSQS